jgi:hypothetical protein
MSLFLIEIVSLKQDKKEEYDDRITLDRVKGDEMLFVLAEGRMWLL